MSDQKPNCYYPFEGVIEPSDDFHQILKNKVLYLEQRIEMLEETIALIRGEK